MTVGLTLVLLCLVYPTHAFAHGLMDEAIQAHCPGCAGVEAWPSGPASHAAVRCSLEGRGAHRRLTLMAQHDLPPGYGTLLALQPLPAPVFADVYELAAAAGVGQGPRVTLHGAPDVESIAALAQDTVLAVQLEAFNATVRVLPIFSKKGSDAAWTRSAAGACPLAPGSPPPFPNPTPLRAACWGHAAPAWPVPEAAAWRAQLRLVARRPP